MIIAVPYEDKQVFQHFGRTETFKVYEVNDGKITAATIRSTDCNSHGALVDILKNLKAMVLICGGIGSGAQNALTENGIQFFWRGKWRCRQGCGGLSSETAEIQSRCSVRSSP
jgi:predicted Fe-Mo cluster-binding NifX family protein